MKKTTETLATGMMGLTDNQLKNLKFHLENGTGIICGKEAAKFSNESGCGCPATMATHRRVPKEDNMFAHGKSRNAYIRMTDQVPGSFLNALSESTPADVRRAIKKVLELRGI